MLFNRPIVTFSTHLLLILTISRLRPALISDNSQLPMASKWSKNKLSVKLVVSVQSKRKMGKKGLEREQPPPEAATEMAAICDLTWPSPSGESRAICWVYFLVSFHHQNWRNWFSSERTKSYQFLWFSLYLCKMSVIHLLSKDIWTGYRSKKDEQKEIVEKR